MVVPRWGQIRASQRGHFRVSKSVLLVPGGPKANSYPSSRQPDPSSEGDAEVEVPEEFTGILAWCPETSYERCQALISDVPSKIWPEPPSLPCHARRATPLGARLAVEGRSRPRLDPDSSGRSRRLPQVLARHGGQVVVLVIGDLATPQHEEDLQPLRREGPQGGMVPVPPLAIAIVVGPRPLAALE